jgi:hypothetical protein
MTVLEARKSAKNNTDYICSVTFPEYSLDVTAFETFSSLNQGFPLA